MGRVRLTLPKKFNFSTNIKVRVTDLNYGGHLGNDSILSLIHEARVLYLQSLGFTGEMDIAGSGIILSDVAIVFKSESFHNDLLKIEVAPSELGRVGCDIFYRISNEATGKEVAHAKTGVFFDYEERKVASVPKEFIEAVNP